MSTIFKDLFKFLFSGDLPITDSDKMLICSRNAFEAMTVDQLISVQESLLYDHEMPEWEDKGCILFEKEDLRNTFFDYIDEVIQSKESPSV
jgi:hypothetical protein